MGYDVHVTRKREWSDADGPQIEAEEWKKLRVAQPELDELIRYDGGELIAKNPDAALIKRLVVLAADLGAKVQGDDGEVYTAQSLEGESDEPPKRSSAVAWLKPVLIFGLLW